ncbi:MAG: hypothetical protein ACYS8W_11895 [Planctomycetota bacterium]|jgi:hypothetical protein
MNLNGYKLGLSRLSFISLMMSLATYILVWLIIAIYMTTELKYVRSPFEMMITTMMLIRVEVVLIFGCLFTFSGAIYSGILGMLKPNPGFGRGLFAAIMPLLTPLVGINFVVFFIAIVVFRKPTMKEREVRLAQVESGEMTKSGIGRKHRLFRSRRGMVAGGMCVLLVCAALMTPILLPGYMQTKRFEMFADFDMPWSAEIIEEIYEPGIDPYYFIKFRISDKDLRKMMFGPPPWEGGKWEKGGLEFHYREAENRKGEQLFQMRCTIEGSIQTLGVDTARKIVFFEYWPS